MEVGRWKMEDRSMELKRSFFFNSYISIDSQVQVPLSTLYALRSTLSLPTSDSRLPTFFSLSVILLSEKCVFQYRGATMGGFNIEDCLKEIIINYYSGDLDSCQANDLLVWINQCPENLEYFRQFGRVWLATGALSEYKFDSDRALDVIRLKRNQYPDKND